jgi:pyridoxamine 5'-phosphate oxidase
MNLADIRKDYAQHSLDEHEVQKSPFVQFEQWLQQAVKAEVPEPTAFTLATLGSEGPETRVVLLKEINDPELVFYTNYRSDKAKDIAIESSVAMNFFWPELERQVRIRGKASKISRERSEAYFQSRPIKSQLGAWASAQSKVIASRQELEQQLADTEARFEGTNPLPLPDFWGGYAIEPHRFEFWQGRRSRLHDRILYEHSNSEWSISRLSP